MAHTSNEPSFSARVVLSPGATLLAIVSLALVASVAVTAVDNFLARRVKTLEELLDRLPIDRTAADLARFCDKRSTTLAGKPKSIRPVLKRPGNESDSVPEARPDHGPRFLTVRRTQRRNPTYRGLTHCPI